MRFRETQQKTAIEKIHAFLKSRMVPATRLAEVSGEEIQEATGLSRAKVYDAIYSLEKKGLIEKKRSGARYRKMLLRVIDEPVSETVGIAMLHALGETWPCPHCGQPIDLRKAIEERRKFLQDALKGTATLKV